MCGVVVFFFLLLSQRTGKICKLARIITLALYLGGLSHFLTVILSLGAERKWVVQRLSMHNVRMRHRLQMILWETVCLAVPHFCASFRKILKSKR